MALKIWTSPLSWNSLRPELVLAEKGVTDFEQVPADIITGSYKSPEFLEKSVFGRVPLLEDGDIAIFESRAIAHYLALKYSDTGPKLMPILGDAKTIGLWGQWLILEAIEFDPHVSSIIRETLVQPAMRQSPDEAALARHKPKLVKCLDVLDATLTKMPYMGGDEYGLVDIFYMPSIHIVTRCLDVFGGRPSLQKWWEAVTAREAWKKVVKPLDEAYGQVVPGWNN